MKRKIAAILVCCLAFGMTACGGAKGGNADNDSKVYAVEAGSAGEAAAKEKGFKYNSVSSQADALMEVASGTSDAAIIDLLMAGAMIGEGTSYPNMVHTEELTTEKYGVGCRKGSDLASYINEVFAETYADGSMQEIAKKYGVQESLIEQKGAKYEASDDSDVEYIKNKGTLIVGITDFEPMDYKDGDKWIGFDADMARVVGEKLGVDVQFVNPLQFYAEVIPKNKDHVEITEINEQYLSEFLEALQAAINQMSADGNRISFVSSKARELGQYMASILDQEWNQMRGMEIQAVGLTISYNEESQKLLNMRNEGAMLSDPTVREGYVQGAMARGLEAAGSNANGAMAGFMGMGMASNVGGGMMGAASNTNMAQMQMQQQMQQQQQMGATQQAEAQPQQQPVNNAQPTAGSWTCSCGQVNTGKFCSECGKPAPSKEWTCSCGQVNSGKFCSNCGSPRP